MDGGGGLRPKKKLAPIETLDPHPGKRTDQEGNDLTCEAHDTQQQCGVGEAVDEPGGCEASHPGADDRDTLTYEEELEVAMTQRTPRVRDGAQERRRRRGGRGLRLKCKLSSCAIAGHFVISFLSSLARRFMISPALSSVSRSLSSSWEMACTSQVRLASLALFLTDNPFVVS